MAGARLRLHLVSISKVNPVRDVAREKAGNQWPK